jgi:hypothetical protein
MEDTMEVHKLYLDMTADDAVIWREIDAVIKKIGWTVEFLKLNGFYPLNSGDKIENFNKVDFPIDLDGWLYEKHKAAGFPDRLLVEIYEPTP